MKQALFAAAVCVIGGAAVAAFNATAQTTAPSGAAIDEPARSAAWRRGAELADSGECASCHSANPDAPAYGGALIDDWYAPAINAEPDAPLPWTADELYAFLRTGSSPRHGVAIGPMSEVVHGQLATLPDDDITALAIYFADLGGAPDDVAVDDVAAAMEPAAGFALNFPYTRGGWLYIGYCVSCHHYNQPDGPDAERPDIGLNTGVTAPDPTNLIRVMLSGVTEAEGDPEAYMPGFGMLLSDRDIADIAGYLRAAYAPGAEPWDAIEPRIAELRRLNAPMR